MKGQWIDIFEQKPKTLVGSRPVRRILKRGVQSTAWPLGHGEREGAGSFYTMDDLECQKYIEKKLQKQ